MNLGWAVENRCRNLDNDVKEMEDEDKKCLSGAITCEEEDMDKSNMSQNTWRVSVCFNVSQAKRDAQGDPGEA